MACSCPSADLWLPRSVDAWVTGRGGGGGAGGAGGGKGGWVNLEPGLMCHPLSAWPPPLPTAGAAAGKVGGGGLFWERLLSNSCHGRLWRFFYRC